MKNVRQAMKTLLWMAINEQMLTMATPFIYRIMHYLKWYKNFLHLYATNLVAFAVCPPSDALKPGSKEFAIY